MVGFTRCNDCKKWKAHKAFVRSRVKRDSELWHRHGYMWHKYKSCNRCFRTYRNRGMSVNEFIQVFGAEEHDLSEPEILIDEVEAEDIKDIEDIKENKDTKDVKIIQDIKDIQNIEDIQSIKDTKDHKHTKDVKTIQDIEDIQNIKDEPGQNANDNKIQVDGADLDDGKLHAEECTAEEKEAENAEAKRFRFERLLLWRVNQPYRPRIPGQPDTWIGH